MNCTDIPLTHEECERRAQERSTALREEIKRLLGVQDSLIREKDRATMTLNAIGDAVITTNAAAQVEMLNPQAERMLGWSNEEAKGQDISQVMRLIDEHTREPVNAGQEPRLFAAM